MRIRMQRNALGSPDASNVYHYEAGAVYTASADLSITRPLPISERLAALFVAEGWAEAVAAAGTDANAQPSGAVSVAENVATPPVESQQASAPAAPAQATSEAVDAKE